MTRIKRRMANTWQCKSQYLTFLKMHIDRDHSGALEPQFYSKLVELLLPGEQDIPDRGNPANWPKLRELFTKRFLEKTRVEWEAIFDGTDACVTPVKTIKELRAEQFEQRPAVTLRDTPAKQGTHWKAGSLAPGEQGKLALEEWWGLQEGDGWSVSDEGFELEAKQKAKL